MLTGYGQIPIHMPLPKLWYGLPSGIDREVSAWLTQLTTQRYLAYRAASLQLRASANNIANSDTDGYQKQQVTTQAGTYGVEVKVEKVELLKLPLTLPII